MRNLSFILQFSILSLCLISWAGDIITIPAVTREYEAEAYLESEHLVTNLHLSNHEGRRPLLLILGGSNPGYSFAPGDWQIQAFLERGYHVLEAEYHLNLKSGKVCTIPNKLSQIRLESFCEQIEEYLISTKTGPFIN